MTFIIVAADFYPVPKRFGRTVVAASHVCAAARSEGVITVDPVYLVKAFYAVRIFRAVRFVLVFVFV